MSDSPPLPTQLAGFWPPAAWRDVHVLVAISGGRDSIALLHLLKGLKSGGAGEIVAGHLNHGLRKEADDDERFVRKQCIDWQVPLEVGHADVAGAAKSGGDGIEAAARNARYEFLLQTAHRTGAGFSGTAHAADDQVETILPRILRGTGIAGLRGMLPARPLDDGVTLVRPLLNVRREAIDQYIQAEGLSFREDASNDDLQFTRNRIRRDLLPKLRAEYNVGIDDALLRMADLAAECGSVIDEVARGLAERCRCADTSPITIDCQPLASQSRYLVCETLMRIWNDAQLPQQAMGKREWETLAEIAQTVGDVAARDFPSRVRARKTGEQLTLSRLRGN